MAAHAIITHHLNLALRLIDSITGRGIVSKDVRFDINPAINVRPIARGDGTYLFIDIGDVDFELNIHVYGYESRKVQIEHATLYTTMPIKEIYLLPKALTAQNDDILTLRGNMPGIKEIEAISLSNVICSFKEFDRRKKTLKLFNQHNVKLKDVYYGIYDSSVNEYEKFEVDEEITTQEVRLRKPLEKECTVNQPVMRIIFGQTDEHGGYMLKVPSGKLAEYVIRYVVGEDVHFKRVNLNNPDEQSL